MPNVSKSELQTRLKEAEARITSLQDELAQAALRVGDLEEATVDPEEILREVETQSNIISYQSQQIAELAETIEGLANRLAYADSIAGAITAYKGPDIARPAQLAASLQEDLGDFAVQHMGNFFKADNILGDVYAEQEGVAIAGNSVSNEDFDPSDEAWENVEEILEEALRELELQDCEDGHSDVNRFGHSD